MIDSPYAGRKYPPEHGYCIHGTYPLNRCAKCEDIARREDREDKLYATLDRLASALDRLAEKLP